jgi:putative SOS response-associated peptidase YedK
MCGRFFIDINSDTVLRDIYDSVGNEIVRDVRHHDIYPTQHAAVLTAGTGRFGQVLPAVWGFQTDRRLLINARAESVLSRKTFRGPFYETRCLIPASGFYEWTGDKKTRQRYTITGSGGLLFFAGLFNTIGGVMRFVILTRASVGEMIPVHKRQPVTIRREHIHDYLSDFEAAGMLIRDPGVRLLPEMDDSMGPQQISFFD